MIDEPDKICALHLDSFLCVDIIPLFRHWISDFRNAFKDRTVVAIAEAPGWEKFLGGKTSTIQFTSEEVSKLKQQRRQHHDASSPVVAPKPPPKPRFNPLREDTTDNVVANNNHNANIGLAPIHSSKSSPSLNQPQLMASPSSGVASKKPHHLRNVSASANSSPWKNSLDSLNNRAYPEGSPISRGFTTTTANPPENKSPRQTQELHWKESGPANHHHHHHHHHHHSNSDSGLSSLSGRTSTMSPISTMSTVSSVSSNSSSGSSSRASLRSASIVSSCTIPLDEEDEEAAAANANADSAQSSPSGTFKHLQQPHLSGSRRTRRVPPPPPPPPSSTCGASPSSSGKLPEELECDEMARELMERLRPGDASCKKLTSLFGEMT